MSRTSSEWNTETRTFLQSKKKVEEYTISRTRSFKSLCPVIFFFFFFLNNNPRQTDISFPKYTADHIVFLIWETMRTKSRIQYTKVLYYVSNPSGN